MKLLPTTFVVRRDFRTEFSQSARGIGKQLLVGWSEVAGRSDISGAAPALGALGSGSDPYFSKVSKPTTELVVI